MLLAFAVAVKSTLVLHKLFTSHMVLQADQPAQVFGWAAPKTVVTVALSDGTSATATSADDGRWLATLASRPASTSPMTLTVSDNPSSAPPLVLDDVLRGDVWLCSGQSNMEFSVANDFDRAAIIASAGEHAAGLRLFAVQKNTSHDGAGAPHPGADVIDVQQGGWVPSTTANVCGSEYDANKTSFCEAHCGPSATVHSFARNTWGYFSAVCYLHGRALWQATGRPQGLLESCWGGQTIESFSSAEASARCGGGGKAGDHYTAMIQPLLNFGIKGAVWCA